MVKSNLQFIFDRFNLNFYFKKINIKKFIDESNYLIDYQNFITSFINIELVNTLKKICKVMQRYSSIKLQFNDFIYVFILYKYHNLLLKESNSLNHNITDNLRFNLVSSVFNLVNYLYEFDMLNDFCILKLMNRYNKYLQSLQEWNNSDKIELVKILSETYYSLQDLKDNLLFANSEDDEILDISIKQKNIVEELLIFDDNILKNIKPEYVNNLKVFKNDDYLWDLL